MKHWQGQDMNTFWGRVKHWRSVVSPYRSFYSSNTIKQYNTNVKAMYSEKADAEGNAMLTQKEIDEYRYKKRILASCMSPDTEEPILWLSRISAFIPTNLPIFAGMLISTPTPYNIVFWQWINQTYNAGLNFGNRNASSPTTTTDILKGYTMACFVSISLALSLRKAADKVMAGRKGIGPAIVGNMVGYIAVVLAGNSNIYAMRQSEMSKGIILKDEKSGLEFGPSKVAAEQAVWSTIWSRTLGTVPVFLFPILWNTTLKTMKLMPKPKTPLGNIVETVGVALGLAMYMPLSCSLYPQLRDIEVSTLEPEVQEAARAKGFNLL